MSFTPSSTRVGSSADHVGVVSYRLARQRMIDSFTSGHHSTEEVCDAQPELRRVAHAFGVALPEPCPICDGDELVTVNFAFGPGLPKAGRVLADLKEMRQLGTRGKPSTCYLIEVCRPVSYTHLTLPTTPYV